MRQQSKKETHLPVNMNYVGLRQQNPSSLRRHVLSPDLWSAESMLFFSIHTKDYYYMYLYFFS